MQRRSMLGAGLLACGVLAAQAQAQSQTQTQTQTPAQTPLKAPSQPQPLAQLPPPRDLRIVDGALPPAQQLIKATQGDTVRWRLVSNLPGEVHVHAYRVSVALQPGRAAELTFTAHATGRFRVEWHAAGGAASGGHHAPPLAVLEVRPR